jgi:hypothetical protein
LERQIRCDNENGTSCGDAQKADEFERLAALADDRTIKNRLADLAIRWHWKAAQAEKLTSEDLEMHFKAASGLFQPPPRGDALANHRLAVSFAERG